MKHLKKESIRLFPIIMLLMAVCIQAMATREVCTAEEKMTEIKSEALVYPDDPPPMTSETLKGEKLEVLIQTEPIEVETLDIYLDKFIVWTLDTLSAKRIIGNNEYIKKIESDENGGWAVTVKTGDIYIGKNLRDSLRRAKETIRVENFVYNRFGHEFWPTNEITVRLRESSDTIRLKEVVDSLHLAAIGKDADSPYNVFGPFIYWNLKMTPNTKYSRAEIVNIIHEKVNPKFCELRWGGGIVRALFTYDTYISRQWGLYNLYNPSIPKKYKYTDLDISQAWNIASGRGINICVIDFGFDVSNSDLKDNIKGVYDAVIKKEVIREKFSHGTACAGVACGVRNNDYGISGVAPDAKLLLARVDSLPRNVNGTIVPVDDQFVNAVKWAIDKGADIISVSLNYPQYYKSISEIVEYGLSTGRGGKGTVFVIAAGNNGKKGGAINFPAYLNGVISVGAVDSLINVSDISSYGDALFAVAPGEQVYVLDDDKGFKYGTGTSYACPAVAGVAALILEIYPEIEAPNLRKIIGETAILPPGVSATKQGEYGPWNNKYGYGLVNAYDAVVNAIMMRSGGYERVSGVPFPDISGVVE
ncbi:MAG: S8 family serine peptidase [Bacteroidales bacterium]|nr:S8 family serine peptidase [Bacteroidales bacterium]